MGRIIRTTAGGDGGVFGDGFGAQPGDELILPEQCTYFYPGKLQGTPDNPIIIRNDRGVSKLKAGIALTADISKGIKITGSGDSSIKEGIVIDGGATREENPQGAGISIERYASDILIERVQVLNTGFGIWCKNEASCDAKLQAYVITNITVQDSVFKNINLEGAYVGSTNLNGKRPGWEKYCSGVIALPPRVGSVKFLRNNFDGCGRAAIQISHASEGQCEVAFNTIRNIGLEGSDGQGNGINIGSYTRVNVHHNDIANTLTSAIAAFGAGDITIEDNVTDNSGYLGAQVVPWAWDIWVDSRETPGLLTKFIIRRNTLGKSGVGDGKGWPDIFVGDTYGLQAKVAVYAKGNIIAGNLSTTTKQPAILSVEKTIDWSEGTPVTPPVTPPAVDPVEGIKFPYLTSKKNPVTQQTLKIEVSRNGTWKVK